MKMAGKVEGDTIETYDSLLKKHTEVENEIVKVEAQLKKAVEKKALAEKRSAAGDLDSYLAELKKGAQVDKETVTKLKVKVSELCKEKDKLVKMINIAKPTNLPDLQTSATVQKPKVGVMVGRRPGKGLGLTAKMKTVSSESVPKPIVVKSDEIKVLEAFLEKDEVETKMKLGEEREIKPIGYDEKKPAKHEPSKKERIGAGDTASVVMKGPEIPAHIKEAMAQNLEAEESVKKQESSVEPSVENKVLGTLDVLSNHTEVPDQEFESEEDKKRKRGDRGTKRNKKICKEQDPEDSFYKLGEDRQYDVWLPPQGQTGDGKTSLNDKLGY